VGDDAMVGEQPAAHERRTGAGVGSAAVEVRVQSPLALPEDGRKRRAC
jgi:hypothetical protein